MRSAFRPGGMTRVRWMALEDEAAVVTKLQSEMTIPLLISADLEGARMGQNGGPEWPNPLALAAIDDGVVTKTVSRDMAH